MDLETRLNLLEKLGAYMQSTDENWLDIKGKAAYENPWFSLDFVEKATNNIATSFLLGHKLRDWVNQYTIKYETKKDISVGIVMAGNIPLVGFHDFLSCFVAGNQQVIKTSSRDSVLIKHLVEYLISLNAEVSEMVSFADNLKGCTAYIATGSNNSSRYFEQYFGKYPHIIRKNRTSVAILTGQETTTDLANLADDIQLYFGLGCRNVTKILVPFNFDFLPLLTALKAYDAYFEHHKYKHNYDYQLALHMMGQKKYMTNGSIVLSENVSCFSPISQLNYEYFDEENKVSIIHKLKADESVQAIVGTGFINFGKAQKPTLTDYPDGVDTLHFLTSL